MPDSVTHIGKEAFSYASHRLGMALPWDLQSIGERAFADCGGMVINFPNSGNLTYIGKAAFVGTNMPLLNSLPGAQTIDEYAFFFSQLSANFALAPDNQITSIGHHAFDSTGITRIVLPSTVTYMGIGAVHRNPDLVIYAAHASQPSGWESLWNASNNPVVWGCNLPNNDNSYVMSVTKQPIAVSNWVSGVGNPTRSGYTFGGWYLNSSYTGTQYMNIMDALAQVGVGSLIYAKWTQNSSCVAEGTLVTLADGTQVAVETLTGNELLLV